MRISALSPSQKALGIIALGTLLLFFVFGRWYRSKVIDQDVTQYYSYLPAVVVHGDITMRYAISNDYYSDKVWGVFWREGYGPVQKYTMGLSWLYAPFFLAGHGTALALGYEADGYTAPYTFWLQLSAVFYLVLGMNWLRRLMLRYYSEGVTAMVMIVLAFGTNLFYYTHGQAAMPHVYLFALVSGLLWWTARFYEAPTWKSALAVGLLCSLAALIRPSHVLLWLIPAGYGITGFQSFSGRIRLLQAHFLKVMVWPVVQVLIFLPQIFYWKLLTERWLYYSYTDERFFWNDPAILEVMFSYRNGWLVYTPVMALGLAGMALLWRHARQWAAILPLNLAMGLYVISCWWCWWYGGCFGQRVLIDYYPMLALGMGALFTWAWNALNHRAYRIAAVSVVGFFIVLNLFQTFQFSRGVIHYDSMSARAYWNAFGRDRRSPTQAQELEAPDYESAKKGIR
ncbi:MAG: hypothetical protein U0176_04095 [Bacteroidia bacterium]